jgi:hypothetical protein
MWWRACGQPYEDATQMDRATMIAQRRDDPITQCTILNKKFSLLSFTQEEIVQKATRLCVSLGDNEKTRLAAAKLIQDNKVQRSLVMLKNNVSKFDFDGDDQYNNLVSQASHLCDDLVDEELFLEDLIFTNWRHNTSPHVNTHV